MSDMNLGVFSKWYVLYVTNLTHDSITKIELPQGYEFVVYSLDDFIKELIIIEQYESERQLTDAIFKLHLSSDRRVVCIKKECDAVIAFDEKGRLDALPQIACELSLEGKWINDIFGKLRLITGYDMRISQSYSYTIFEGNAKCLLRGFPNLYNYWGINVDISDSYVHINSTLKKINIPLKHNYIELARMNYELSFMNKNNGVSFLILMTALEAMMNDGGANNYKIPRHVALLLSKNEADGDIIFSEIQKLYDTRSAVVHEGSFNKVQTDDLDRLKEYTRKCILKLIEIDRPKKDLLKEYRSKGFGAYN